MLDFSDYTIPDIPDGLVRAPQATHVSNPEQEIIKKAYNDALYTTYKSIFSRQILSDFFEKGEYIVPADARHKELLEKAYDRVSVKPPYFLMTVNPKVGVTYAMLKKAVEKFVGREIVKKYAYVYEVRDEKFNGLHCHILLEYGCKPYDFKRAAKSTFKKVCDIDNPHILNFVFVDEKMLESKYNYLRGEKKKEKLLGVESTKTWRKLNNIPAILESTPNLLVRGAQLSLEESKEDSKEEEIDV